MKELHSYGTDQNIKVYKKHGAGDNLFGVSFANLNKLMKKIKIDHDLAKKLWETGNTDARTLATMIADPDLMTETDLDIWLNDISYYMLIDVYVSNIVNKTPFARSKMEVWVNSDDEWICRAGWQLLAKISMNGIYLGDDYFADYLNTIEHKIHNSKNRVKDAMNSAIIAIGLRNNQLEQKALAAASRIGKIEVDHGDTPCRTPDAIAYIKKVKNGKR